MSHVNAISPAGPLTATAGQTLVFDIDATVPEDASYSLSAQGDDGSTVSVSVTVDRPALALVFGSGGALAPHEARVTASGGTLAAVAGQPGKVAWTLPA